MASLIVEKYSTAPELPPPAVERVEGQYLNLRFKPAPGPRVQAAEAARAAAEWRQREAAAEALRRLEEVPRAHGRQGRHLFIFSPDRFNIFLCVCQKI